MAFIIMTKVAHFVFTTHHSKDHNFYTWPWNNRPYHLKIFLITLKKIIIFFGHRSVVAVLCLLFPQLEIENCIIFFLTQPVYNHEEPSVHNDIRVVKRTMTSKLFAKADQPRNFCYFSICHDLITNQMWTNFVTKATMWLTLLWPIFEQSLYNGTITIAVGLKRKLLLFKYSKKNKEKEKLKLK